MDGTNHGRNDFQGRNDLHLSGAHSVQVVHVIEVIHSAVMDKLIRFVSRVFVSWNNLLNNRMTH